MIIITNLYRYCTLVFWSAFIVLHLGTSNKALTMSFSFSLSASIALVLLFFPKIYIILLHPEKNIRASYATTKLLRCHFGNSQTTERASKEISNWKSNEHSLSRLAFFFVIFYKSYYFQYTSQKKDLPKSRIFARIRRISKEKVSGVRPVHR